MRTIQIFLPLFVLILFGLGSVNAQMTDGKPRIGIKAGINGSNLYDDAMATNKKTRAGITAGVFAKIPFAKGRFALRPELLVSTRGGAYDLANGNRPDFKLTYVELPLSLELRVLGFINLHAGGYASILASGNGTVEGISATLGKGNFESYDYGWHAGAGIDLGGLGLHFRLSRGLKNVGSVSVAPFFGDLKNAAWALTLSYGF